MKANTAYKLINIDVTKMENQLEIEEVKLPTATNDYIIKTVCSKEKKINSKRACVQILVKVIIKLQERSPLKPSVVRKVACFSPVNMVLHQESSILKLETFVDKLFQAKHLSAKESDAAKSQYDDFLKSVVRQNRESFEQFCFESGRLDQFLSTHLNRNDKFKELWKVCIFVFTMSHGQSAVERGFNINKHLLVENLNETSMKGQRLIYDYFTSLNVKLHEYIIPKELLFSCKQAHARYEEARKKGLNQMN